MKFVLAGLLLGFAASAGADVFVGQSAPNFTKSRLGGGTTSLTDYPGKVVVMFLFGYDCPFCLNDAPSVETDVRQYYASSAPGQVQVIGADLWNGTVPQVTSFRDQTGVTFPLLLNGAVATGGNLATLYGTYDNYIVINKQGIVRYHAAHQWPHGNRYHLNEIRGAIDSLVSAPVSVGESPTPAKARLAASPNPFRRAMRIELALPVAVAAARLTLHDVTGRRVALVHEGALPAGPTALEWDANGAPDLAPGIYLLAATLDGQRLQRRVVKLP